MLQRQDSLLSMSHRQTPPPPPTENQHAGAKPMGCMSAIFKLFSKYHTSKKRLTFRKKNRKCDISTQTETKFLVEPKDSPTPFEEDSNSSSKDDRNSGTKRLTRDITPRSPTLPPEIRLPNDVTGSSGNTRAPPALVARLMGMEKQEEPPHRQRKPPFPVVIGHSNQEEEEEEKRKRLLQALEKCNEDLESLKKIIMAVQSSDKRRRLVSDKPPETCKPRPVSGDLSPPCRYSCTKVNSNGIMPEQRKQIAGKKPGEGDSARICMFKRVQAESFKMRRHAATPRFWNSMAMIQSVDEVCDDVVWGEERELTNVGLVLDSFISRDLIEEVVFELGFRRLQRLPFDACRRRISF